MISEKLNVHAALQLFHVAQPVLSGNEEAYVQIALRANRLTAGPFVERFERDLAEEFSPAHAAVATSSGTGALHLALAALGVGPGDEVLVPATTFIATANAVTYCGATPVFVDVWPDTWCLDLAAAAQKRSARTKAVIPVDLYGYPVDVDAVRCALPGLAVVEDACEALGARNVHGRRAGSDADAAVLSFHGSKTITTGGEGGAVVSANPELMARVRLLAANGQRDGIRYRHHAIGFNYRMTDVAAAIGCGQLERLAWHVGTRCMLAVEYRALLSQDLVRQASPDGGLHARWAMPVLLPWTQPTDRVAALLAGAGIETRPLFPPLPLQPAYAGQPGTGDFRDYLVADELARRGLLLPMHAALTSADVAIICAALGEALA